jgi:hypothetical protein
MEKGRKKRMNNLLDQWNEHIIKGNHLSRELEVIEDLIEKSKGEDICFTSRPNGATYITILSPEKMQELRENALVAVIQARNEKVIELEKLMGVRKPATINPVFEAAVKEMEESSRVHKDPDPVEEKLTEILQEEAKRIEDKPIKEETKAEILEHYADEITKLCKDESNKVGDIADKYGVKKSDIYNFMAKHKISRAIPKKNDVFLDTKVSARQSKSK